MPTIAILLAFALIAGGIVNGGEYSGPRCLGPFCLDGQISTRVIFKQLGPPAHRSSTYDPYCYAMKDGKASLSIYTPHPEPGQLAGVLLADFPNCLHASIQTTSEDLRKWKTREGIGLGSLETEVLKAYGGGSREKITPRDDNTMKFFVYGYQQGDKWANIGEETISYHGAFDDLRTATFCIRDGKVSCIFLSQNE